MQDGKSATHDLCFGKLKLDTSIMPYGDNRNRYEYSVERLIDPDSHPWWKDPVNLTHVNPSQEVTDERVRMWRLNSAMRTLRAAREAQDSALRAVERVMSELTLKRVDEKAMILDKMGFSPDPNGGAERDTVSTIIKRVARGEAEFGKLAFKTAQSSKGKSECSCSSERLPTRSACGQTEAVDREDGSQAMIVRSGSEDGDDGLLTRREKIKGGDTVEKSDADIPRTESSSMKRVRFVGLRGEEDEESPMKRDMVSRKRTSKIRKAADEGAVKNADKQTKLPESEELSRTDRSSPMKALELFSSDTISMLDGVKTKVNEVNTLLPTFRSSSKDFDNATKLLTDIRAFDDRKELERIERQAREKCGGPTSSGRGEETFSGRLDASASRTEWEQGAIDSAL